MIPVVSALLSGLALAAVPIALRVLAGVGVGVVVYQGVNALLDSVVYQVSAGLAGLPASGLAILQLLGFQTALSIILSAVAVRLTLLGVSALTGSLSVTRFRPPTAE
jgi:hypothetical protein